MGKTYLLSYAFFILYLLIPFDASIAQTNCADSNGIITVTNTNDIGPGSLREAIHCANSNTGENTIVFDIPGTGDHIIYVGSFSGLELPALLATGTIIDGTTQPGHGQGNDYSPKIILDGSQNNWTNAINAIWLRASYCEVYGLEIRNFPDDGIDVNQADFCKIGAANKGNIIYANGYAQDEFPDATPGPWEGCGIVLRNGASHCVVQGNIIGTDEHLSLNLNNEYCGIINRTASNNNIIGGNLAGQGNIIAYQPVGIRVDNSYACQLVRNSFFCNDSLATQFVNNANLNPQEALINLVGANSIGGLAVNGAIIEVYATGTSGCDDAPCQGKHYLGSTTAVGGTWTLNAPYANNYTLSDGEKVTALSRDANGNSSEFSTCNTFGGSSDCTDDFGAIWVTNTNDSGAGSLREAIHCANATEGANTIKFNLPGNYGIDTIRVGATTGLALPALTDDGTSIDGTTHPLFGIAANYQPRIVLDGQYHSWTAPIDAIWIRGDYCSVFALEIVNFPDDGIDVTAANFCTIGGINKGNVLYNNGWDQDFFPDAPNTGPWNGCALVLRNGASHCNILGNILGTNYQRNSSLGNEYCGVIVQHGGDNNRIGGNLPGEANVMAYNQIGISISANSTACSFRQNEMYCNTIDPIRLQINANNYPQAPVINAIATSMVSGQAISGSQVDVYLVDDTDCADAVCQGAQYLGTTTSVNGNWTLNGPFVNGVNLGTNDVVTAIATDSDGNSSDFAVCNTVTIGCGLTVNLSSFSNASCGLNNGSVTFNVTGGSGFYTYDFGTGNGQSANPVVNNLAPGSYVVTIKDITNDCSIFHGLLIQNSGFPDIQIDSLEHTSCGLDNAYLALSVNFGATPFTYDIGNGPSSSPIFSNLASGTYTVTVSDANGCTDTEVITLSSSDAPTLQVESLTNASCNLGNGSVAVSVTGGMAPYSYDIGDGPTDMPSFDGLTEGTYTITVTDGMACTNSTSITIDDSGIPQINIVNIIDETCHQSNGAFSVDLTDGLAPFTYDIGNGPSPLADFDNLSMGTYNLTVTDAANCSTNLQNIIIDNQGEDPIADFSQSSNALTLNVQNNASFGTSYLWDFGDGNTSDETAPSHDYAWSGYYNLCLTVFNTCGTDTLCKGIIVMAPNEDLLSFELPAIDGEEGEIVFLPFVVDRFQNVSAFDFSIEIENPNVAKFLGVNSFNLAELDNTNFVVTDQNISCTWSTTTPNGVSLANQSTIFIIALEMIGNGGDCTNLIFSDQPTPRNAFRQINGISIKVPTQEINGTACILEPLASVNIAGTVEKENGVKIANALVNCSNLSPTLTLSDGSYAFNDLPLADYTVQPFNDNDPSSGVSVLDVFLIQQHILHINYLDSPYKIIAADVDHNENISVLDLFELQRIILNLLDDFTNNTSWRFIPKSHVFPNPQAPFGTGFPEAVVLDDLSSDTTGVDFIAMKTGDMTLNANLSNRPPVLTDEYFDTQEQELVAGEEIEVVFSMKALDRIAAYQFELNFDTDYLSFVEINSTTEENNAHQFAGRYLSEGILSALWVQDFTKNLHKEEPVFKVSFKVLKNGLLSKHLRLSDYHMQKIAYEADGKEWGLNLRFQTDRNTTSSLKLIQNYPNPFSEQTEIIFSTLDADWISFEVFDVQGKLIRREEKYYPKGEHVIELRAKDLRGAGVYFYRLRNAKDSYTEKLIHQN